eukprot:4613652-Pyramimonas_sp.AAC.1
MRVAAGKCLRPSSGSRSPTAALAMENDPCWHGVCAPITRWSKEVWAGQWHSFLYSIPMSELNRAWSLVFEEGAKITKWSEVSGPVSALHLSLKRPPSETMTELISSSP